MLIRLQPQGTSTGTADGLHDSEANTATLHETTQRLHGQHLSGQTEGAEGSAFTTPAGVRCPQGQSPLTGVSDSQKCGACAVMLIMLRCCEISARGLACAFDCSGCDPSLS